MTTMLIAQQLSKRFHDHAAVQDVSFHVDAGEVFCLLGANGAGKTTTVNMLLGFLQPTSGTAKLLEYDTWKNQDICRCHMMYIPENVSLYGNFSAVENIDYLAALAGMKLEKKAARSALEAAGLSQEHWQKPVGGFSKGMRQKVVIAFAFLKQAKLILMDEPTSGLDPSACRNFIEIVQQIKQRNTSVLVVTHDLQCAHLLADRIGIMSEGRLVRGFANRGIGLDEIEDRYFECCT